MNLSLEALRSREVFFNELVAATKALKVQSVNNDAAVFDELKDFVAKRTVSWVAPVGNTDVTVFQLPARSRVTGAVILTEVVPVAGAGLTSTQVALGTAAGGQQFILNKNFLTAGLPAAGTAIGITTAELGTSIAGGSTTGSYFHTAQDVFLRITNAGGAVGTTAGSLSVFLFFDVLP